LREFAGELNLLRGKAGQDSLQLAITHVALLASRAAEPTRAEKADVGFLAGSQVLRVVVQIEAEGPLAVGVALVPDISFTDTLDERWVGERRAVFDGHFAGQKHRTAVVEWKTLGKVQAR